jgi:hypothetical protein
LGIFGQLHELYVRLDDLSIVALVLSFFFAIKEKRKGFLIASGGLFAFILIESLFSGWKGSSLNLVLLLSLTLYTIYRKKIIFTGGVIILLWIIFMPYYNQTYRQLYWYAGIDRERAAEQSLLNVQSASWDDIKGTSWELLSNRTSEINLFIGYIENVPAYLPYYGAKALTNSVKLLLPRIVWPDKPNVEQMVMERVYDNNIVSRYSIISAKPHLSADAYLAGGWLAIVLTFFSFGAIQSLISSFSERLFGGYFIGTALIYSALFQIFWLGSSFEFLITTTFWSLLIMFFLFFLGRYFGIIRKA